MDANIKAKEILNLHGWKDEDSVSKRLQTYYNSEDVIEELIENLNPLEMKFTILKAE